MARIADSAAGKEQSMITQLRQDDGKTKTGRGKSQSRVTTSWQRDGNGQRKYAHERNEQAAEVCLPTP